MNKKYTAIIVFIIIVFVSISGCTAKEDRIPTQSSEEIIDEANAAHEDDEIQIEAYKITKDPEDPYVKALLAEYIATRGGNIDPKAVFDQSLIEFEEKIMNSRNEEGVYTYQPKSTDYHVGYWVYHDVDGSLLNGKNVTYNVNENGVGTRIVTGFDPDSGAEIYDEYEFDLSEYKWVADMHKN